jgi:TPR repeat protein
LLGNMYRDGKGVTQDYAQAVTWYRKAADQGNAIGQCLLGNMYRDGKGVTQDEATSLQYFAKAAEEFRNMEGRGMYFQYWYGFLLENGLSMPKNEVEALLWYKKCADQGYEVAKLSLAQLQKKGK